MRKNILALLSVGTMILSSVAPAYAETNSADNSTSRYREMEKPVEFDTSKVEIKRSTHSFDQTIVYTTFNKDKDPKEILNETVLVDETPYVITNTDKATLISEEKVDPLVKYVLTDTFIGDETSESNQPLPEIKENGIVYSLTSKTLQEGEVKERTEHKSTEITYTAVEDSVAIPKTTVIDMTDKASGKDFEATLELTSEEILNEYWDTNFEFPITVSGYGANVFVLNGHEVPGNAELIDYKDEFLSMLNLNKDAYKIESIEWDGESYEKDGHTLRNAVAKGSKYVKDVKAMYSSDVVLPAMPEKSWKCTYKEVFPEGDTLYTMATNATYTIDSSVLKSRGGLAGMVDAVVGTITAAYSAVIESFSERPVITSIPLVLFAGFIAVFMTRRLKARKVIANRTGNI